MEKVYWLLVKFKVYDDIEQTVFDFLRLEAVEPSVLVTVFMKLILPL